ncbi:MAG: DUF86 domain-containing protein [Candidatus Methanoplasma sp.]|jgi:uncharacterized protein with HEPN domain|nr:DUF86 domain-containing protein [Candidatus Methanoplasma sp.]
MIDQCNRIEDHLRYYGEEEETFKENWRFQDNVILNLERIGEAANNLPGGLILRHPEINWSGIIGIRVTIAHHYWRLDMDLIWITAAQEVPKLKAMLESILGELEEAKREKYQCGIDD